MRKSSDIDSEKSTTVNFADNKLIYHLKNTWKHIHVIGQFLNAIRSLWRLWDFGRTKLSFHSLLTAMRSNFKLKTRFTEISWLSIYLKSLDQLLLINHRQHSTNLTKRSDSYLPNGKCENAPKKFYILEISYRKPNFSKKHFDDDITWIFINMLKIKNTEKKPTHKFYESFGYFHEKLGYILKISYRKSNFTKNPS